MFILEKREPARFAHFTIPGQFEEPQFSHAAGIIAIATNVLADDAGHAAGHTEPGCSVENLIKRKSLPK